MTFEIETEVQYKSNLFYFRLRFYPIDRYVFFVCSLIISDIIFKYITLFTLNCFRF